jgi:dTDP-4-dehydrorhamnose 3,5-epimerase
MKSESTPGNPGAAPRFVAERRGLRLVIVPHPKPGIGDVVTNPSSAALIPGIEIEPFVQWPDDRGTFGEMFRFGTSGIARDFLVSETAQLQVSVTLSYPGVIKAIHYHFDQTDLWVPIKGMFQVFLCDLREGSPACGRINTMFVGDLRPWKMRIPPGVAHGYKILGTDPGQLVYATNRHYNPEDEGRILFDDAGINYDWVTRPK